MLALHPELARRVRIFSAFCNRPRPLGLRNPTIALIRLTLAVPYMAFPHERFDDLWNNAFASCQNIEELRWQSVLPVPQRILEDLVNQTRLRILTIPAESLSTPQVNHVIRIKSLQELTLLTPDQAFQPVIADWINSMSNTLTRLHIEVSRDTCHFCA